MRHMAWLAGIVLATAPGAYGSALSDCTLTRNFADGNGGGACGCTLTNCTLAGNSAAWGGGTYVGTLDNCGLLGNAASSGGGGAYGGVLGGCSLIDNTALAGGGAYDASLRNCIVYHNGAQGDANWYRSSLTYCCTTPDPGGVGNLTNAPLLASAGNPHLLAESPCLNAPPQTASEAS